MKLQDRNLSIGMQGADVKLLQEELRALDFDIPQAEIRESFFREGTEQAVMLFQQKFDLERTGVADRRTAELINKESDKRIKKFIVRGQVLRGDRRPLPRVSVRISDMDLRSQEELDETRTDADGRFELSYFADKFTRAEKDSADLLFEVSCGLATIRKFELLRRKDKEMVVVPAPRIIFNAGDEELVEIVLSEEDIPAPSEYERLVEELTPLLKTLSPVELEEDESHQDITFLSGETGFATEKLVRFALAHRLAAASCIDPEFWYALLIIPFYQTSDNQSIRDRLAVVLAALPSIDATAVRKVLASALSQKLIPSWGKDKVDTWTTTFLDFVARQAVSGDVASGLKNVLEDAGIRDTERQEKFARLLGDHRGLTPELVEVLKRDGSFEDSEIADLQTTFQIAELTQGNFSAARVFKNAYDIRQPDRMRLLAKASEEELVRLVRENVASGDLQLPADITLPELPITTDVHAAEAYGKTLAQQFREAFPTTAFTGGLDRAMHNGGVKGLKRPELVGKFLEGHEEFEFLTTPVDDFFKTELRSDMDDLAQDEELRLELKGIQRVFKLAPNFEATDELLADDLHSASKIYRMGETEFERAYADRPGFTLETARLAWNRAADTHAAVLTIVGELQALDAEGLPVALLDGNEEVAKFPNWNTLFKTGDLCECEQCRSVYSPAAYFADLLMFLKERKAKNPAQTVKDILFQRRPDLGYLELNCENANTPLPYIDVVCEVLEDVIANGENDLELPGLIAIPDASAATKTKIANAFAARGISLGDDFTLSQVKPTDPNLWVAHGDAVTYLLKKKATPNFFAEILRNTKASAAELRANPQYVNPNAHGKLKTARYPFALPFDLSNEEVGAAFQKVGVKRWELMRTFKGMVAPNNPTDGDIAAEYFGISVDAAATTDEKRIILTADVPNQHEFWGETAASLIGNVSKVDVFLQKTGLEYQQLLTLLDLKFINPTGDIAIVHLDPTCDTEQKRIETLDATKLDRVHRFLRLWGKLEGWKMWELALALRVLRDPNTGDPNGDLDEAFLVKMMHFTEVKYRLRGKVTVEQTAAMFDNLNTITRFTKLHEKREDALYQNLFLNKKLIHPLDPAFQLDPNTDDLPTGQTITAHQPIVQAALGVRETDLLIFKNLTKPSPPGTPYINDELNLANLSFLWRHAWLAKMLNFKAEGWKILLKVINQDVAAFASPQVAWDFLEKIGQLKNTGFKEDELNWLLCADRSAKAAVKETDAAKFLFELRKALQTVRSEYDASKYEFLTTTPPTDEEQLAGLLTTLLQKLNRDETAVNFFLATLRGDVAVEKKVAGLAAVGFPAGMPIKYDATSEILRFTGVMTSAQQTTLNGLSTDPAYLAAIEDLFDQPRLAVKFFEPVFIAPLETLPPSIDFKTQLPTDLAAKIVYDAEQRLLRFTGIMSKDEQAALNALVPVSPANAAYHTAVDSLAAQPQTPPPGKPIWLTDPDLDQPTSPDTNTAAKRIANAIRKSLAFLSNAFTENEVVQQFSDKLGLTAQVTRKIVETFQLFPPSSDNVLQFFTDTSPGAFSTSGGALDYTSFKKAFDTWYWLNRVAAILKKWKVNLEELEAIIALQTPAQLLDFKTLPLDAAAAVAPIDAFLRTHRLFKQRDTLPETGITLLEILEKLNGDAYATAADFSADVQLANDAWNAADVERLTQTLDLTYPIAYLLAENWERLRDAFRFLDRLNAGTDTAIIFANPAVGKTESDTLKQLLRSKFGAETWFILSAEIQDVLRERKRHALVGWLVHQFEPTTPPPPSGKWENANDVYGYYLLDAEMSACQLTSRLVQASGSVQLFVQRCHMGLEPHVLVKADGDGGDSAWRWWKWMKKYRVWEANRKVFLYPENWIEPELRRDKSELFKDLENELLQNEVNQYTVETAFLNYLDKLDGVAQLEISNFYQEDDADRTILHVFGRTQGGEPHIYYYRQFDYRRWTPWEKVDLDIAGDYLIPAVVNKRLFLFWPVFTEVPDETENNRPVPIPQPGATEAPVQRTTTRHRLQIAAASYHQKGTWNPKKVSKDFYQSGWITEVDTVRKFYHFIPIDRSDIDGRFVIKFGGYSLGSDGYEQAELHGAFEIAGCKGVPELAALPGAYKLALQPEWASIGQYDNPRKSYTAFMKWIELGTPDEFGHTVSRHDDPQNDFTLENLFAYALQASGSTNVTSIMVPGEWSGFFTPILIQTPNIFKMSPPWHFSYMDRFWLDSFNTSYSASNSIFVPPARSLFLGSWLPFFYADKKRTFCVLPSLKWRMTDIETIHGGAAGSRLYYPEIKKIFRQLQSVFEGSVQALVNGIDLSTLTPDQRKQLEEGLRTQFPGEEAQPRYTKQKVLELLRRFYMRFFNYWLGYWSYYLFLFRQFHFKNFYHPFVCDFARLVYNPLKGIPALMSRETQLKDSGFRFFDIYQPTQWVVEPSGDPNDPYSEFYPKEDVDFTPDGAYSPYNWELFFHAPLMIANQLSKNQRFDEAMQWYHFIFNPLGLESKLPDGTIAGVPQKYWITKPFFLTTDDEYLKQRIDSILRMLAGDTTVPGFTAQLKKDLEDQVRDWRDNPFEPHRIAQYRTVAYQKTTVMKYLDNLIAWGDYLFRQDSMESINEATQLYVLAAEILGPRPRKIPPQAKPPLESFNELEDQLDRFSNALVEVENFVPPMPGDTQNGGDAPPLPMLYFCIPQNDKLFGYWDTVADRLYKIRHCMNIEGVARQLALFEPPIEPGALVKAVAAGVDIASALADLNAPLPLYRFSVLLQKANELCNDVKALGSALLSALEKKDAEAMGLLRQSQEIRLLAAVKSVREQQITEAQETAEGSRRSRNTVEERRDYYRDIAKTSIWEDTSTVTHFIGIGSETTATILHATASTAHLVPGTYTFGGAGFGGSPVFTTTYGSENVADSSFNWAIFFSGLGGILHSTANLLAVQGSNERRWEEWKLQEDLAEKELAQIDKQIAAAELRIAIAAKELENHVLQIENAQATDAFMRSKYTNEDLFQWQVGQISGFFFQSYKLAYDLAKRAERCFRFELGLQDGSYIQFGYWDSLKKGLLSGEKLQYDLRRLESAYIEQNRREFELTKHVSLALLDPLALVRLKETGRCFFRVPEEIFDLDYAGHYFRRIKSVSITLPCVTGPYTTVSCTLRLLKNSIRINPDLTGGYAHAQDDTGVWTDDLRFVESNIPVKAIAASNAQNDSGVFELSFRDERYLPFEGAGAVTEWSLELFSDTTPDFGKPLRQFDYGTITDAVVHVKYTAREDAGLFKNAAIQHLREYFEQSGALPSVRLFNLRQEFPTQWHRFLHPINPVNGNVFALDMLPSLFPFKDEGKILKVNSISLLARCINTGNYSVVLNPPLPAPPPAGSDTFQLAQESDFGGLHFGTKSKQSAPPLSDVTIDPSTPPIGWRLKMTGPTTGANLAENEVEDLLLVLGYEWD